MRVIWAFAVVCLMAAAGVAPAHAAAPRPAIALVGHAAPDTGADRLAAFDRHPALPALAATRSSAPVVTSRYAAALPLAVLATPPALPAPVRRAIASAPHRAVAPGSRAAPTCSARGPPAR